MKFEIEVDEKALKAVFQEMIDKTISNRHCSYDMKQFLESRVKEALDRSFKQGDFMALIEENCRKVALAEIEAAAKKKTPGWVNQQMKEMLKYAKASFWEKQS
jgi:rRNA-processing protein FCF1